MAKSCNNTCGKVKFIRTGKINNNRIYGAGAKWCKRCDTFIAWEGIWCPCCHSQLRTKPKHQKFRRQLEVIIK